MDPDQAAPTDPGLAGWSPSEWVSLVLSRSRFEQAALDLTTELSTRLGCERVALGFERRGRVRVEALSHSARFDRSISLIRDIAEAMHEACDQDCSVRFPRLEGDPPRVERAHEMLSERHGGGASCSVPLVWRGRVVGALTFERAGAEPFDAATLHEIERVASLVGPALALQRRVDSRPTERVRGWLHEQASRWLSPGHLRAKGIVALALVGLVVSAGVPGTHRVRADATLEGLVQRAIVAGIDGYVSEASARAGDLVVAGQVLARLDDRDLALERRKWQAREQQLWREYREALARHDRSERNILQARLDEARAQVALLDEQLERTKLVAPFDGIVVRGDLSQSLGAPVSKGEVLYEIAPAEGYRIILEVDERDVAHVVPGRRGGLLLAALPGESLALEVEQVTPVSTAENGRNYFRVEASLEEPLASLRPGMAGVARIDIGRRKLAWILTHELVDWLRLMAWSWLP